MNQPTRRARITEIAIVLALSLVLALAYDPDAVQTFPTLPSLNRTL